MEWKDSSSVADTSMIKSTFSAATPKIYFSNFSDYSIRKEKKMSKAKTNKICEICSMTFKHDWIYEKHILSHKAKSKFHKCSKEGCNKSYKSKENLILHFKNFHLKEKPYKCNYCDLHFSHRNGKTYHERKVHTKILPNVCTHSGCNKAYASKSALKYHLNFQH